MTCDDHGLDRNFYLRLIAYRYSSFVLCDWGHLEDPYMEDKCAKVLETTVLVDCSRESRALNVQCGCHSCLLQEHASWYRSNWLI